MEEGKLSNEIINDSALGGHRYDKNNLNPIYLHVDQVINLFVKTFNS